MRSRSQRETSVAKELANVSFRPRPSSPGFFDPVVIVIAAPRSRVSQPSGHVLKLLDPWLRRREQPTRQVLSLSAVGYEPLPTIEAPAPSIPSSGGSGPRG